MAERDSQAPARAPRAVQPADAALRQLVARLGLRQPHELLFHLPLRYEDHTRLTALDALRPGTPTLIEGEILQVQAAPGRRPGLWLRLGDGRGVIDVRFFRVVPAQRKTWQVGARLRCHGLVRAGVYGFEMTHPSCRLVQSGQPLPERALAIYPTVAGVSQDRLRRAVADLLARLPAVGLGETLPAARRHALGLMTLEEALQVLHAPLPEQIESLQAAGHPARRRLAWEELLADQLVLRRRRYRARSQVAPALVDADGIGDRVEAALGFALTAAQRRVLEEVRADLARPIPMLRLVQGDVGSGKTAVAALAAAMALGGGWQVALMAPTELLAEQHVKNFHRWFAPVGIEPLALLGRLGAPARRAVAAMLATDQPALVVGTHALFQDWLRFGRLGLVMVDEQHRFGVQQRLALQEKGSGFAPHQLVLTATPIPRTLAMGLFADLDVSVIDALPPGRAGVRTVVLPARRRDEVAERVRAACRMGAQVYWVCPLIEDSEQAQGEAAEALFARLGEAFPDLRLGLVHGRLGSAQRAATMTAFVQGALDVLVATTVIEVGVDVPKATVMVVENAERFGLAQLHQLRGRVGRGTAPGSCVLLYEGPLSLTARARLETLREVQDGFEIARRDLELRGAGEWLGTRQTGERRWRVADPVADADLMAEAQIEADRLLAEDPALAERLIDRWQQEADRYAGA